jgi:nicotinamidase-related amidase
MRSAYAPGFEVITLTDCTATVSAEAQQMGLTHDFGMLSHPMTHSVFLEKLF